MNKANYTLREKILLMYSNGMTVKDICTTHSIKRSTLYRWIHQSKLHIFQREHSDERKKTIFSLLNKGVPVKVLSERFKISMSTIYYWLKIHDSNKPQNTKPAIHPHIERLKMTIEVLKQTSPIPDMLPKEKYEAIKLMSKQYSITLLCDVFDISKSTYYNYAKKKFTANELRDIFLKTEILNIYKQHKKRIGGTKIRQALQERGIEVSEKKVYQLMNNLHISKQTPKNTPYLKLKKNTNSTCKNILRQRFNPLEPNLVWVSDVTEIKIKSKPVYLCIIMDLFARKIIDHSISLKNNTKLVEKTFNHALSNRKDKLPVMFHSDRGSPYTSYQFRQTIQRYNITQSFSAPGYPYDNSPMESFFSQYKRETLQERSSISTIKAYKEFVQEYIDYYNAYRFHRGLGLLTPNKKEELYQDSHVRK